MKKLLMLVVLSLSLCGCSQELENVGKVASAILEQQENVEEVDNIILETQDSVKEVDNNNNEDIVNQISSEIVVETIEDKTIEEVSESIVEMETVSTEYVSETLEEIQNDIVLDYKDLGGNWYDMQFSLDGVSFKVPFKYTELNDIGYSFNLSDYGYENGYIMNPGDSVIGTVEVTSEKYGTDWNSFAPILGFKNLSDNACDITETHVYDFKCNNGSVRTPYDNYANIQLAKGITWGSTKDDIFNAYGEPTDIYVAESSGYTSYTYKYTDSETNTMCKLKLNVLEDRGLWEIELEVY